LLLAPPASAEPEPAPPPPAADDWGARYDAARAKMIDGRFRDAERDLRALALEARTNGDRLLALEMAKLAAAYAERTEPVLPASPTPEVRSGDEITLLYASAFLYGVGSGVWFLLETSPDSAATATIPFAVIAAAPVIAVATVDGITKLKRGLPHALSAGLYLGLGEGIWVTGFQHSRAARMRTIDPSSDERWVPETVATVLWGSATLGATLGGALGSAVEVTPGRVSFAASTALWTGTLGGLAAGALLPDDEHHDERSYLTAGVAYNAGLVTGTLLAGDASPSVARVRLVDLLGVGSALATSGIYLSLVDPIDARVAEGLAALGGAAGVAAGWYATRGMAKDMPLPAKRAGWRFEVQPSITPVRGGATLGVAGTL
jgi:hypothetical protein